MTINQLENQLFAQYTEPIVKDGMVDEAEYLSAPVRILFLLKEPRNSVNKEEDLRVFARDGSCDKTWNLAMRLVKVLLEEKNDFPTDKNEKKEERIKYARKIIWMNNSKGAGPSRSDNKQIRETAEKNRNLLKKQFALYNQQPYVPNIIYCGGTSACYRKIFDYVPPSRRDTSKHATGKDGLYYIVDNVNWIRPCLVIEGYHPQQTSTKQADYGAELLKFWQTTIKQSDIIRQIGL